MLLVLSRGSAHTHWLNSLEPWVYWMRTTYVLSLEEQASLELIIFWLCSSCHLQSAYKVRVHMELATEIISKCYS